MSRISNDLAGQIALKLTEKSRILSDNLHLEYRELITQVYESQTPTEIRELYKKYPEWFYTRTAIIIDGNGFRWEKPSSTRPVIQNNQTDAKLLLSPKVSEKILASKRKWEKAKAEYDDLRAETKQALLTLKTFSNIRKELPEAAPLLPPPLSNSLIVNFDSLHKKLSKQPDVAKKEIKYA